MTAVDDRQDLVSRQMLAARKQGVGDCYALMSGIDVMAAQQRHQIVPRVMGFHHWFDSNSTLGLCLILARSTIYECQTLDTLLISLLTAFEIKPVTSLTGRRASTLDNSNLEATPPRVFEDAALTATLALQFKPPIRNGRNVKCQKTIEDGFDPYESINITL